MQHSKGSKPAKLATIALSCSIAIFSAASIANDAAKDTNKTASNDADMDYKTFVPSPQHSSIIA